MKYRNLFLSFLVFTFLLSCSKDDNTTNPITDNILTVKIGTQVWMKRNLDVDHYRNGDPIRHCQTEEDWADASNKQEGAWCYYNNDPAMGAIYGKLYNFYAVADYRGLAPIGRHIPTDAEWAVLVNYLGGSSVAGGKLKSIGTIGGGDGLWLSPNSGATNESGFSGLPGGGGRLRGEVGVAGAWWSSTEYSTGLAFARGLSYESIGVDEGGCSKSLGFSVRCIKD